jgi:ornithine cyclodeaminase/alanine dehydrogenase-like protein (mu-crystallin family)
MRVLYRSDVERLVQMAEAIDLMRTVFRQIGRCSAQLPERVGLALNDGRDSLLFMPGYLPDSDGVGVKIVSVYPENPRLHGLSTINGVMILNDPATGEVTCLMDAVYLTALRTGAVSGLATDLLARPDCKVLAAFGAGVQARAQIDGILQVRAIERVVIYAPTRAHARALAQEVDARYGPDCRGEVAHTPDGALADADIVVTATTATSPVLDGARLREGTHVNVVGSFKPWAREVDGTTIQRARIFVDQRAAALQEAGDLLIAIADGLLRPDDIVADLGELVLGSQPRRRDSREITLFKSVGLAAEDVIVAQRVLQKAEAAGVGVSIAALDGNQPAAVE